MKTILVGVDGSPEAKCAAELATRVAESIGAKVVLAFCVAPLGTIEPESLARYLESESAFGVEVLREAMARCSRPGVPVESVVLDGAAASCLAAAAEDRDVHLVAVGHRGRGAVRRVLLGSVADRLVQICPKPVLVAR